MPSFAEEIRRARIAKGLSLREVAASVTKDPEPGRGAEHISIQYLNDIEHKRRNPPSELAIAQLAKVLGLSNDYLVYLAGGMPKELRNSKAPQKRVEAGLRAFRKAIKG